MFVGIRSLPGSADILRHFWTHSKAGTQRFFRVEDSWLPEIGRGGQPLVVKETKAMAEKFGTGKEGI